MGERVAAPPLATAGTQVREISNQMLREPFRWTGEALLALQHVSRRPLCAGGGGRRMQWLACRAMSKHMHACCPHTHLPTRHLPPA